MTTSVPHIVTDSTADIPAEITQRLDITVIPCVLQSAGQSYRDGIDITRQEFYRRLRQQEFFSTSQPSVGVFAETYRRLLEDGRPVVAVHLASRLSGLYSTAQIAANEVDGERITVVDSRQLSMCTGWLAIHAGEAAQEGRQAREIVAELQQMVPRLRLLALIDDLRFLQRSGRVGWISSLIGSLFALKPIVLVREGRADLAEKVRSWARGIERLAARTAELGALQRLAVLHADAFESAAELAHHLERFYPREQMIVTEASAIVAAHAGPGAIGVGCLLAG